VIVGGYALAFYGAPRFTGDLDILVKPDAENAGRVIEALKEFGFVSPDLTAEDFVSPDLVVQIGLPPVRVDILTSITGVSWDDAWKNRKSGAYGETATNYIGMGEFVKNKQALGRKKDLADLESLDKL